jgi:hypothetical protein
MTFVIHLFMSTNTHPLVGLSHQMPHLGAFDDNDSFVIHHLFMITNKHPLLRPESPTLL